MNPENNEKTRNISLNKGEQRWVNTPDTDDQSAPPEPSRDIRLGLCANSKPDTRAIRNTTPAFEIQEVI